MNFYSVPLLPAKPEHNFELIKLGSFRRDQYLLDKATGQIWQRTCPYKGKVGDSADCTYAAWMKDEVQDLNGSTFSSISDNVERMRKHAPDK